MAHQPQRFKVFPPRWRHLRLPMSSRRGAAATLALWSPCRRTGLLVQRAGRVVIGLMGARALPGRTTSWEPPWDADEGSDLMGAWRDAAGTFDGMGIYERPQATRTGLALLLLRGTQPAAFVRVRATEGSTTADPALNHEHHVLGLVDSASVTAFTHPRPLDVGKVGRWSYLITTVLGGFDRPAATGDVDAVLADIRRCLADLPRGDQVPDGWEPMHGDLTPWNLRVRRDGSMTLVDWEDASWGPPDADAVLLHASRRALFGIAPPRLPREAAEHWLRQVTARPHDRLDDRLRRDLISALREISAR